jgi:UDP-2,4-diacetamido-2,4,6-trideoxy-beta-L-altropyranose hydrolase
MTIRGLRVLFRVAAGPRVGFGHLVRCRSLARALGVVPFVSVRGTAATRRAAGGRGWHVVDVRSIRALADLEPSLVVVDDPSQAHATTWVRWARQLGIAVASIHDLGLARVDSDFTIDGSVGATWATLHGPMFAILDPRLMAARTATRRPVAGRLFIALGGGAHVGAVAARLSRALVDRGLDLSVRVAAGFASERDRPALALGEWVSAPNGLATELSRAELAIVAGGITAYECCALGVPAIAMPVTSAQRQTVHALARLGAVIETGFPPTDDRVIVQVVDSVATLHRNERLRARLSAAARRVVDGGGAFRVADALRQFALDHNGRSSDGVDVDVA